MTRSAQGPFAIVSMGAPLPLDRATRAGREGSLFFLASGARP